MKAEIEPLLDRIGSSYYAPHTSVQRYESGMSSPALDQVPSKGSPGPLRGNGGGSAHQYVQQQSVQRQRFSDDGRRDAALPNRALFPGEDTRVGDGLHRLSP